MGIRKMVAAVLGLLLALGCMGLPALAEAGTFDTSVVEEFDILSLGGMDYGLSEMDDPVGLEITRRTGVRLNFEFPVGDWNEKLALVLASGDYPDLIMNKDNAQVQLVNSGALVGLKDKIEASPNIIKYLRGKSARLTQSLEDPEYYGFGSVLFDTAPKAEEYWSVGFALQNDLLIKAGFPKIETVYDFEKLIADYLAENPEINGMPAIGVSLVAADGWRWKISVTNPAFLANGKPDDGEWYVDTQTYKAQFHYKDPMEKEYFRWLNHMNDIGLLDPESFTQSYDAYQAKVASGRVIGLIDALWEFDMARKEAVKNVGPERDYTLFPALMDAEKQIWSADRSSGGVQTGGLLVTTACKNVDKIVNFMDFMASEEGMILKKWGIEGEHYTIDANGQRVQTPEVKAMILDPNVDHRAITGIGKYIGFYDQPYGVTTSNGQLLDTYDDQDKWDSYTDVARQVFEGYGVRGNRLLFPAPDEIPESPYGAAWMLPIGQTEEAKVIQSKVEEITLKSIARAVLASPDQFDAEWDQFMKEIEDAKIGILEDEVTQLVAERMELWGSK